MRHDQDAAVDAATVADDVESALLADLLGRVARRFPWRETRALCQVDVTLTYAARGHALTGRALYVPESGAVMKSTASSPACRKRCCSPLA